MTTRAKLFSQLAKSVDASGTITSDGISSTVSLGATVYDSIGELPMSGYTAGEQAFVKSTSRLYINSGVGWYNVAVINNTPTIQSILDSDSGPGPFSLATDGTATTITITAQDSDGDALTYTASADSDFNGLATISQASNVFTITPLSQDSATTESGTITFNVTDNINIANSVQTFTLNFVPALWDETVLSIGTSSTNSLSNSAFIDRSANAHTVTPTGTPIQTAFHPYLDNWSVEFDGANDWIQTPTSNVTDMGTGDFTIECWFYRTATAGNSFHDIILSNREDASFTSGEWSVYVEPSDGGKFGFQANNNLSITGATCTTGKWHHVAVVRLSGTIALYVDGTLAASSSYASQIGTTSKILNVGAFGDGGYKCEGYVSNVRLVNGTALYTSTFTPPTEKLTAVSGTSLLTCQSNRFIDNSTNAHTITVNGDPKVSAINPFGQESEYAVGGNKGATYFNGSGDYLQANSSENLSGDFTIECWVWHVDNGVTANPSQRVFTTTTGGNLSTNLQIIIGNSTGGGVYNGAPYVYSNTFLPVSDESITEKGWHHIAVTRDGSDVKLFVNGVQKGSTVTNSTSFALTNSFIGTRDVGVDNDNYSGYISDLKVVNGTAIYTTNFTPPTAPVGNANASLYLSFDNAGIFDKTGINSIEYQANVATSTSQTKYSSTSILHDNDVTLITLPTGLSSDFTIEGWFYVNDTTAVSGFFQFRDDTGQSNSNEGLSFGKGSNFDYRYANGTAVNTGTISTIQGQWFHFAYARTSNTLKAFINGTQDLSVSDSTDYSAFKYLHLGMFFSSGYTGDFYVENFQVLNGVAKYTSNFTPPTQEQGRQYQAES